MAAEADPQVLAQIKLADEVHYLHLFPSDPSMIFSLGKTTTGELDMTVFWATEGSDIKQVASYGLRQHDSSALADHTKILVQKLLFYGIKKFALIIRPHLCLVGIRLHLWMLIFFHLQITVGIAEYIKAAINK